MIDFATLFTRLGRFFAAGDAVKQALATDVAGQVDDALQGLGSTLTAPYELVREGVRSGLESLQNAGSRGIGSLVQVPTQNLTLLTVKEDSPPHSTLDLAIRELIDQMEDDGESLDASTVAATAALNALNAGTGEVILSTKRADGKVAQFIFQETLEAEVLEVSGGVASFTLTGTPAISALSPLFPGGSGVSTDITSRNASSTENLVGNGTFEESDEESDHLPEGWIAPTATLGTTLKMTSVEVQTVAMSSDPTDGYYLLHWTNGDGQAFTTVPLDYAATSATVQTALRAIPGLEAIEVAQSGTSPNLTHTITFYGVTNPAQLTSTDATTGGSIAHATTTAASSHVLRGARAVEFDADGAQLTTIMRQVELDPLTQYAVNLFAKVDVVPAAGVLTVDLVDGVGGTVLADEEATNNSFTIDATALTTSYSAQNGFFRTPATLPPAVFLRIRQSTAISSGTSCYIDEVYLGEADELYTDGLCVAIFDGAADWEPGDRFTLTVTNDYAGELHHWLDRCFSLRENRLIFPTNAAGAETIADSLLDPYAWLLLESGEQLLTESGPALLTE